MFLLAESFFYFASSSLAEITMDRESSFLQKNEPKPSKTYLMGDLDERAQGHKVVRKPRVELLLFIL